MKYQAGYLFGLTIKKEEIKNKEWELTVEQELITYVCKSSAVQTDKDRFLISLLTLVA